MQGRHQTGCVNTSARPFDRVSGDVSCSRVGPKSATTDVPIAAAMCIAPESLATQAADSDSTPPSDLDRRLPRQVDDVWPRVGGYSGQDLACRGGIAPAADHHAGRAAIADDIGGHARDVRQQPAFGGAVRGAWCEDDQRPHGVPAAIDQLRACGGRRRIGDGQDGLERSAARSRARASDAGSRRPGAGCASGRAHRAGQQRRAHVRGVAPSARNGCAPEQPCGGE